jgi:alkanesulfonate monooxygenase SsuD/methylene tetrahydromethanopterin reductase-like flavin-dependent oxidoreductase (luciferase family)
MAVDFGLGMLWGPPKGVRPQQWMENLDVSLPRLAGHFKSLWMTDHFFWNGDPTYEAWTVLSYMAAKWPQFDIGPMVLGQSYRNPALLAKMAATLQVLSNGRFIMGIGAGWKEDEYHAYDYPFPRAGIRMEQLIETLEIMKRLWTEPGKVTYEGKHYKVVDAWCEPKPDPIPTIMIGGGGNKTIVISARYADWWNHSDANYEVMKERLAVVDQACEEIGRDPATLRRTWFGRLAVGKTEAEAIALSKGEYTKENAFVGTALEVVELMQPFVSELGVDYFMLEVLGLPDEWVIETVINEVLPKVG